MLGYTKKQLEDLNLLIVKLLRELDITRDIITEDEPEGPDLIKIENVLSQAEVLISDASTAIGKLIQE